MMGRERFKVTQATLACRGETIEVHGAKNNEAHGAMSKKRHVCARRRVGEPAVS